MRKNVSYLGAACLSVAFGFLSTAHASAGTTHVVCPGDARDASCKYKGGSGIQAAIDAAASGDEIVIKTGRYTATAYRDVPYKVHTIRGFAVIDRKNLTLTGEPGAVLDGTTGVPTTAIVVRNSDVAISKLTITGFRYDVEEDETYEGHGIFVIDSTLRIDDVTISKYQKMGLTGRGASILNATNLRILDGHVAIWLHESAYLRLRNAIIRGNDSAGIAAYQNSVAHVANAVFDGNLDDGLYGEDEAAIFATNSLLLRNKPAAAHATGASRIWIGYSGVFGNAEATLAKDGASVRRGPDVIEGDPRVDANYRLLPGSPLAGKGDPEFGASSRIGPR
jgi:hypothetical protein